MRFFGYTLGDESVPMPPPSPELMSDMDAFVEEATKAGVIGMTKVWARELGKHQIRVNAVAPGFIATEMIRQMPEKAQQAMVGHTPLGRVGEPEDIANAYVFLASNQASFITGAVLSVDGGAVTGT